MKRHRHLWERVVGLPNLFAAAREAMRGKRGRESAARFFARWETEAVRLHAELASGAYAPGPYTYFTIREPKERVVAAAPFRDRVVHHAVVRVIEPLFDPRFVEDSFACRKGRGTHAAMRRAAEFARRFPWALKCDIRRYFPSIDHGILMEAIGRVVADERLLGLIGQVLASHTDAVRREWGEDLFAWRDRPRGLPIGNLTSQFFANIYLDGMDRFVKQTLRVKGYVRYVDDFVLFGPDRATLRGWGEAVRGCLDGLRLEMHPDKYRLMRTADGVDFCGFVVLGSGRIRVRASSVRRFARRYRGLQAGLRRGDVEAAAVTASVRAWIGHAAHAQSWGLRREVLGAG